MRTRRRMIAAALSVAFVAGCGGEEARPVPLEKGDMSRFDEMKDAMTKDLKAGQKGGRSQGLSVNPQPSP